MNSQKKILVIDDDSRHLTTVKELLEAEGHNVYTYSKPFGSTQLAKMIAPDLILLDINMPGLSGDALSKLLKTHTDAPIVFHSSNDEDSLRQMVQFHRVRGYICKGDPSGLRRKVADFLSSDSCSRNP